MEMTEEGGKRGGFDGKGVESGGGEGGEKGGDIVEESWKVIEESGGIGVRQKVGGQGGLEGFGNLGLKRSWRGGRGARGVR